MLAEKLFENETEEICRQAIELAKKGNIQAIKIILDRILPTRKETPITMELPVIKTIRIQKLEQAEMTLF